MHFGVSMFHTDYSIPAMQLARALEKRGSEWRFGPRTGPHITASS
jgi:hypothetical protein